MCNLFVCVCLCGLNINNFLQFERIVIDNENLKNIEKYYYNFCDMKKKKYKFPQRFKRLRRMANNRCKIYF